MTSSGRPTPKCTPTWRGWVETPRDALLIFEACFNGNLSHCFRRPHDRERRDLIVSGNIFVYEEATSGIKRWTDGLPWSPSRILTNYLIYRQLDAPFPAGEKKRATKRKEQSLEQGKDDSTPNSGSDESDQATVTNENRAIFSDDRSAQSPSSSSVGENGLPRDGSEDTAASRALVGSLVDSYEFKENGLLKKTMTVTVNNVQHHLVSYYSVYDAKNRLKTPRDDKELSKGTIRPALLDQPKFKCTNLDDPGDGSLDNNDTVAAYHAQPYYHHGYDTARMYATPHGLGYPVHGHHYYYASYQPHAAYPQQPPQTTYVQMPPTSAAYAPTAPPAQYAQPQSHYYAPPAHSHSQYQHQVSQASPYAAHYHPGQPAPAATYARPPEARPDQTPARTNGHYEYGHSSHAETGTDIYGPSNVTAAPVTDNVAAAHHVQPPQSWHAYPSSQYLTYRPTTMLPPPAAQQPQSTA